MLLATNHVTDLLRCWLFDTTSLYLRQREILSSLRMRRKIVPLKSWKANARSGRLLGLHGLRRKIKPLILLAILAVASSLVAPFAHAQTVVATVNSGGLPYSVAYDSARGEVFVADYGSNTVSVIDGTSNTVVATVSVGSTPFGVAYDSAKGEVFVAISSSNTVSVIRSKESRVGEEC